MSRQSKQELAELLQVLLEVSQTGAWRLWRNYTASLLEAALEEMEEAKTWEAFLEARALVRYLRAMNDFVPELIRQTEVLRREPSEEMS